MDNIQKGLENISGDISKLTFNAGMIISRERGINHPQSESRDTTEERKILKVGIDNVIEQLQILKNSF